MISDITVNARFLTIVMQLLGFMTSYTELKIELRTALLLKKVAYLVELVRPPDGQDVMVFYHEYHSTNDHSRE
jgi:hypothetical protein